MDIIFTGTEDTQIFSSMIGMGHTAVADLSPHADLRTSADVGLDMVLPYPFDHHFHQFITAVLKTLKIDTAETKDMCRKYGARTGCSAARGCSATWGCSAAPLARASWRHPGRAACPQGGPSWPGGAKAGTAASKA